jgi:methionyl-tRNA synthetase
MVYDGNVISEQDLPDTCPYCGSTQIRGRHCETCNAYIPN